MINAAEGSPMAAMKPVGGENYIERSVNLTAEGSFTRPEKTEIKTPNEIKMDYSMINDYIGSTMEVAIYAHKQDTATSYYWQGGSNILPNRLSISRSQMSSVQRKGRNMIHPVAGQLLGSFKVTEESPLKQHKPFEVRTQIWQVPLYPSFIGYGTIGISGESGKVEGDTGDLIILNTTDCWDSIMIFYFAGMGNITDMEQVMKYLSPLVEAGHFNAEQKKGDASQQNPSNGL